MDEMKKTVVKITDEYSDCLSDSCGQKKISLKPKGHVEIYEIKDGGEKELVSKNNLIVYQAREWIGEKLINLENSEARGIKDHFIAWLGLGDGGVMFGAPFTPISPNSTDTGLGNDIPISTTDITCADYRNGDVSYYKHPFDPSGGIIFEQDLDNNNEYIIIKITTTIGTDDANGKTINEAGLFLASSNLGEHLGTFTLFSKVTFPGLGKDNSRQLVLIWYLYV